jgi:hypothetical protein
LDNEGFRAQVPLFSHLDHKELKVQVLFSHLDHEDFKVHVPFSYLNYEEFGVLLACTVDPVFS